MRGKNHRVSVGCDLLVCCAQLLLRLEVNGGEALEGVVVVVVGDVVCCRDEERMKKDLA